MPPQEPAQPLTGTSVVPERLEREILRLAVPAFLALVAEPVFLLCDAAIVGHLGTAQLAGLGIAGAVVSTAAGLCVFLAYGTTASVARRLGAGDQQGALRQGVDGLWLAVLIGGVTTLAGLLATGPLVGLFSAGPAATGYAATYLRWGIAGSAIGTVLAQLGSATALVTVVVRAARRVGAPLLPDLPGVRRAASAGVALVVRTLTLRAALIAATYGSAALGVTATATHQVAMALWNFLAFALDALAIAAQALTGRALGAGDVDGTRSMTALMVRWGAAAGVVGGLLLATAAPFVGALFTTDPAVRHGLVPVLLVAAVFQPVAGVVFVLDGVLIGAGDGRYLAWGGVLVLAAFAPLAWLAVVGPGSLTWLWVAFGVGFISARAVVLLLRARTDRWLVTGAR